ncbi:hypothetical protein [Qipengyuania aquimaris]|uniref:Uncharacterized protein n=1 Tax=Qipengyuania aquimaris TaxID=255984 RepID=A0A9Q3S0E8_9SPHN|nr:hypothetical protein [Qipengyuania aquimaris]MBY6217879.1 hypothetical protein [Qipengyuania aquimaris]
MTKSKKPDASIASQDGGDEEFELPKEALAELNELAKLLLRDGSLSDEEFLQQIMRAARQFNGLKPSDGAEHMLAQQMVGAHAAAIECLRRAALPDQTFEGRDMAFKHAHKLMALYARQLETLNKHRGKGQQKVTVEHVNVEKGGQAIVGNVETGGSRDANNKPRELEHKTDDTVPLQNPKKTKVRARKRK